LVIFFRQSLHISKFWQVSIRCIAAEGGFAPRLSLWHSGGMTQTVSIPLWLLLLILAFAVTSFLSNFLFPSVRWFFRRRIERWVARLNERLDRPIDIFKLAARQDRIARLSYDPQVLAAVTEHATAMGIPASVAFQEARHYAREIVPGFSTTLYFGVMITLAKWLTRQLYRVRFGRMDHVLSLM
jgi:glycerol-3-phosphate O-acyltransferase